MYHNSKIIETILCFFCLISVSAGCLCDETEILLPTPTPTILVIEIPAESPTLATSDFTQSSPETSVNQGFKENVESSGTDTPTPVPSASLASVPQEEQTQSETGPDEESSISELPISPDSFISNETDLSPDSVTMTPTVFPTLAVSDFSIENETPPEDSKEDNTTTLESDSVGLSEGSEPSLTGEETPLMALVIPNKIGNKADNTPEEVSENEEGGVLTLGEVVLAAVPSNSISLEAGNTTGPLYTFSGDYSNGVIEILQSGLYHLTDDLTSSLSSGSTSAHTFAIKISASDVVLDGNQKTVTISSSASNYADAIQINGSGNTVQNFGEINALTNTGCYGIYVNRTSGAGENAIIQNNQITGGVNGIQASGTVGENIKVINNSLSNFASFGISINSSGLVSGNTISGKGGISLGSSDDMMISGNNITATLESSGITNSITSVSTNLTINQNQIRNASTGISMGASSRGTISSNSVTNGSTGIKGGEMDLTGNTISGMSQAGIASILNNTRPVTISDNVITGSNSGIEIYSNTTLTGNTISGNNAGLTIPSNIEYQNTYVYNNLFSNTENVGSQIQGGSIAWTNPSGPTPGTNVIGGPNIAGNYWGYPDGTGYSDLLSPDASGYNSTPYLVVSGTYDTAPLVRTPTPTPTPSPTVTIPPDNSQDKSSSANPISDTRPGVQITIKDIAFTSDVQSGSKADLKIILENSGSGKPLAGATIILRPVNEQAMPLGTQTTELMNGTYQITVPLLIPTETGTYVFRFTPIQVIHDPKTEAPIEIPAGEVIQFTLIIREDETVSVTSP